jgi:uncharacterized protein YjbJ (UPF0337 family)
MVKQWPHRFHPPAAREVSPMTWDQVQGSWMQFKGKLRQNWAMLSDDDLMRIDGRREELIGRLQARYGFAKAEAEREIDAWLKSQKAHAA